MFSKKQTCPRCRSSIKKDFDFCPYCGCDVRNPERDLEEYGLLGKNEFSHAPIIGAGSIGIGEKILANMINGLMRTLEAQIKDATKENNTEVQHSPNGMTIKVHSKKSINKKRKSITEEQLKRMTGFPRIEAKTNVRRLTDKIIYELKTPGVSSIDDVFISKVESGYEIKAIGNKKVYVNNLPLDLPLINYNLTEEGIVFEFEIN